MKKTGKTVWKVALIALILYLTVIAPMIREEVENIPELLEGEVYENKAIFILRKVERTEIASVEIKNDYNRYSLISYQKSDGSTSFYLDEDPTRELSEDTISTLLGEVRLLITNSPAGMARVNDRATEEDLALYGLDEASDPSWFTVTLHDGTSYRIIVGDALTTSKGYYAMLDGRRNTVTSEDGLTASYYVVYDLQSGLSTSVLAENTCLISTMITPYYGNSIFNMTDFALTRLDENGEREMILRAGLTEKAGISASNSNYRMIYPKAYMLNEDIYNKVLSMLSTITAEKIVAFGDKIFTPEVYEKYGLDLDPERLESLTDKNHGMLYFNCADESDEHYEEYACVIYFGELSNEVDGSYYYVYSPAAGVIAKISAVDYEFFDWSIAKFTSEYLYYEYFTSAEFIELVSAQDGVDLRLTFSGKENNRRAVATTSGDDGEQIYVEKDDGGRIPLIYDTKYSFGQFGVEFDGSFENLRDLYYVLITRQLALTANVDTSMTVVADTPTRFLSVKTSPKDHPITYYLYDSAGNKSKQLRDQGGNILCTDIVTTIKRADGSESVLTYDEAYYDVTAKKFFRKAIDTADGMEKPMNYGGDADNYVTVTTYLSEGTTGVYSETVYEYEFYDLYDEYVNIDGETVRQLNATYSYVVPTTKTLTYRLSAGGERELLSEQVNRAEEGVYIRTAMLDKLYSDTNKMLAGETLDLTGVN